MVILSDQFVVRAYSSHEAWKPGPIRMPAQETRSTVPSGTSLPQQTPLQPQQPSVPVAFTNLSPQQQQQLLNDPSLLPLSEQQRLFVITLSNRTGLNASFSIQCLDGNGWDGEKAVANFEAVRVGVFLSFNRRD